MGSDGPQACPGTARARCGRCGRAVRDRRHRGHNEQFAAFVEATGLRHRGRAQRLVVRLPRLLPGRLRGTARVAEAPWWRRCRGPTGARPEGPAVGLAGRATTPSSTSSWNDARPTARGRASGCRPRPSGSTPPAAGYEQRAFPGVTSSSRAARIRCNIWQGRSRREHAARRLRGTAPGDAFEPNGFGLYNISGNVWEWCDAWFASAPARAPGSYAAAPTSATTPTATATASSARTGVTPDSSTGNVGFRVSR